MRRLYLTLALLLTVCSCSGADIKSEYPEKIGMNKYGSADQKSDGIFGGGVTFGSGDSVEGLKVNSYLWRASLDTISFMPLATVDPFGGVITTDWYSSEDTRNERFKLNVIILSSALKADGVKVSAFSQTRTASGEWRDKAVDKSLAPNIENAILTRARELRQEK